MSRPKNTILEALEVLQAAGIVAVPTETVWGLICDPTQPAAVERLYRRKQRPSNKPLQCLCSDIEQALALCAPQDAQQQQRLQALTTFWPGALTVLVPASPAVPEILCPEGIVGVRVPKHPQLQALIAQMGGFVAASSFNLSGAQPVLHQSQADQYGDCFDVLWGEGWAGGVASTVYHLPAHQLIRAGEIGLADIELLFQ